MSCQLLLFAEEDPLRKNFRMEQSKPKRTREEEAQHLHIFTFMHTFARGLVDTAQMDGWLVGSFRHFQLRTTRPS